MHIVVFGATGNIGRLLVARLVADGHTVTAFCHSASGRFESDIVQVATGDVGDASAVRRAVIGVDAVVSALGSWGTKEKNTLTVGMQHIVPAMHESGVRRIVSLTGSDARLAGENQSIAQRVLRPVFTILAGKILRDGEQHMSLLQASGLDWTVVRSPVMRTTLRKSSFRLDNKPPLPWETVQRSAVADAMISALYENSHIHQAPFVHSDG